MTQTATTDADDATEYRWELISAVLLGLATLLTAFCALQSAAQGGISQSQSALGARQLSVAVAFDDAAAQALVADQGLFLRYVDAEQHDDTRFANYVRTTLFTPELEQAVRWWERARAAGRTAYSPFDASSPYGSADEAGANRAITRRVQAQKVGERAGTRSDRFNQAAAIFAITLFAAGIAVIVRHRSIQLAFVATALAALLAGAAFMTAGLVG